MIHYHLALSGSPENCNTSVSCVQPVEPVGEIRDATVMLISVKTHFLF